MTTRAMRIIVLLSVATHPYTGRPLRADLDARALELALQAANAPLLAVHAGAADAQALHGYLGMGLSELTVLEAAPEADVSALLLQHIRAVRPDLVLCGSRAQAGEASGYLPYLLAHELGWPLAAHISGFTLAADEIRLQCALARGRRRELIVKPPLFATVSAAAPNARQSAFARARRGRVRVLPHPDIIGHATPAVWQVRPARARPKRLKSMSANLAGEELLKALTDNSSKGGQVLSGLSAPDAADRLIAYLRLQKML